MKNMFYSFVFVGDINKKEILANLSSNIDLPVNSYKVIFLNDKKTEKENILREFSHINFKTYVFKENSTYEQMFEALINNEKNLGTIIYFKNSVKKFKVSDINQMIEQNSRGAKIVVSKQCKNSFWFNKIVSPIKKLFTKFFLGITLYPGEADIILIDEVLASTMVEMVGKSTFLTSVNGWAGVEPKTVIIPEQQKTKNNNSKKCFLPPVILGIISILLIVSSIVLGAFNVNISFLGWFVIIVFNFAVLLSCIYLLTKSIFKFKNGDISYTPKAEIIEIIDNLDE